MHTESNLTLRLIQTDCMLMSISLHPIPCSGVSPEPLQGCSQVYKGCYGGFGYQPIGEEWLSVLNSSRNRILERTTPSASMQNPCNWVGFLRFPFSSSGFLSANVVFAGFGFSINTDSLVWDDYQTADVPENGH